MEQVLDPPVGDKFEGARLVGLSGSWMADGFGGWSEPEDGLRFSVVLSDGSFVGGTWDTGGFDLPDASPWARVAVSHVVQLAVDMVRPLLPPPPVCDSMFEGLDMWPTLEVNLSYHDFEDGGAHLPAGPISDWFCVLEW